MWKSFRFEQENFNVSHFGSTETKEISSTFDDLLRSEWNRALSDGLFNFEIENQLEQRILNDENLVYTIELNPSRFEKRRAPEAFFHVDTPFDRSKFHFNRIRDEEILFSIDEENRKDRFLVIINNSPIRRFHVLLVPDRNLEQKQILTVEALRFGFEFLVSSSDPFVYVGFNSLCAYASVNHLHLHGLFLPSEFFLQTIEASEFCPSANCFLFDLCSVESFVFEVRKVEEFQRVANSVISITNFFVAQNIAHNLCLIKGRSFSSGSDSAVRIFIWFRRSNFGAKVFEKCNFACLELSGFMFLRFREVFENLTGKELREEIESVALPIEQRTLIKSEIQKILLSQTETNR